MLLNQQRSMREKLKLGFEKISRPWKFQSGIYEPQRATGPQMGFGPRISRWIVGQYLDKNHNRIFSFYLFWQFHFQLVYTICYKKATFKTNQIVDSENCWFRNLVFEQWKADAEKVENADFETNMRTTKLICIQNSKSIPGLTRSFNEKLQNDFQWYQIGISAMSIGIVIGRSWQCRCVQQVFAHIIPKTLIVNHVQLDDAVIEKSLKTLLNLFDR